MSLIDHILDQETHSYSVPDGEMVLSTSDVIAMSGLSDFSQVPRAQLEYASHRGSAVHLAIQAYEEGRSVDEAIEAYEEEKKVAIAETATSRMKGYYRFRDKYELTPRGQMERSCVYRHACDQLIGGTPDFPCYVNGQEFILDVKTSFKNCGAKAKQDSMKWKVQLQSYAEIEEAETGNIPAVALLHLHENCGKGLGFEFHVYHDNSLLWASMVVVARAKLLHGHKLPERG